MMFQKQFKIDSRFAHLCIVLSCCDAIPQDAQDQILCSREKEHFKRKGPNRRVGKFRNNSFKFVILSRVKTHSLPRLDATSISKQTARGAATR